LPYSRLLGVSETIEQPEIKNLRSDSARLDSDVPDVLPGPPDTSRSFMRRSGCQYRFGGQQPGWLRRKKFPHTSRPGSRKTPDAIAAGPPAGQHPPNYLPPLIWLRSTVRRRHGGPPRRLRLQQREAGLCHARTNPLLGRYCLLRSELILILGWLASHPGGSPCR
jgi:hypothetical protein